jgi:hypothetical protein
MTQVALVSTVRGLDPSFVTWLRVHLAQGVARIHLVLDAPEEDLAPARAFIAQAGAEAQVRLHLNDGAHRARVADLPGAEGLLADAPTVVVARQMLNVAVVMQAALEEGSDWLLHLDSDELVVPYGPETGLLQHLAAQPSRIDEVIYPNFEAVPDAEEVADPFLEVRRFKKSPYYLKYREFEHLYTAWNGASGRFKLFNAYITGKAALRLGDVDAAFIPFSVHHFLPLRFSANVHIEDAGGPVVLHYPHCGLARFVGRFTGFNAARVDTYDEKGFSDDLYGAARRLVAEGKAAELPELYRRQVLLQAPGLRARLERHGYLFERDFLSGLL